MHDVSAKKLLTSLFSTTEPIPSINYIFCVCCRIDPVFYETNAVCYGENVLCYEHIHAIMYIA